ncbi:DUF7255 family protein [Nafulsella turpanensis]|uniref:DUF7255 family protein n=1 Tax=Nafulsella turpanensis TaxID=1265690 RepID=UPI00034DC968|nr:hypothetical protein [Nafulsella turpanensis]
MERLKPASVQPHFFRLPFLPEGFINQRRLVLKKVLVHYMGLTLTREQPALSLTDIEYAGLLPEVQEMARLLRIAKAVPREVRPVETEVNGIAIAIDEEGQFNEYRMLTLQSSVYNEPLICQLKRYKAYCQKGDGGLDGGDRRNRNAAGHIRKKSQLQPPHMALNDFMQDMLPVVHYIPLLRISVYDTIRTPAGIRSLASLLEKDDPMEYGVLAAFLEEKLTQLESSFHLDY